jgi:photosystem II stability/assembly factor-like uncharacterized protein
MFTSAVLAVLLTVAAQEDAQRLLAPERPIFGMPTEKSLAAKDSPAPLSDPFHDAGKKYIEAFKNDARLTDICFIDAQYGWAVGEHGVVWHTEDGGRQWQCQNSGVDCSLQSVYFISRELGWAAGGLCQPYSRASRGLLLFTRDGGRTWNYNPRVFLPALKKILFLDADHGWAIGVPSAMYPSGVFASDDGGRSWQPLIGSGGYVWLSGDFLDGNTGALAGFSAATATVKRGEIETAPIDNSPLANLRRLRLVTPLCGWLVGDGALVMQTRDAGASWQKPPGDLPPAARHFDFTALAARGPKAWIAGTPGTRVFYTADAGKSWNSFSTGTSLPLEALTFIDDEHGWAAGALGTILATSDGGRSWQCQRCGGARAAVLGLVAETGDVPLELLAKLSGNDGYLSAVEVLCRRDVEVQPGDGPPPAERLQQAVAAVGGSHAHVAWQFPLRQTGLQLTAEHFFQCWDAIHRGRGGEELEAYVVRQMRLWRPDVVVTQEMNYRDPDQLRQLIGKIVLQAVDKAADPNCYGEQIAEAGLAPWQVKKTYAITGPGARGAIVVATSQIAARLGRSLADAAAEPRGLLGDRFYVAPWTQNFRLLSDRTSENQPGRDLMSGLRLLPGGDARREPTLAAAENIDLLQRLSQKQRNTQAILELAAGNSGMERKLLAQSGELIRDLDENSGARVLYQLADQYYHSGRWSMTAETFQLLIERYPRHVLARPALLWLVQYHASGEAAWRRQKITQTAVQQVSALTINPASLEDHWSRAGALGKMIERTQPDLFAEPALRFPLAAAQRKQGALQLAQRFYTSQSRSVAHDAWSLCAQGEKWLTDGQGRPPKPVAKCRPAAAKPKLDGQLDDDIWQKVETVPLESALKDDGQWPAVVAFAYDAEFLYIAIHCRRAPGLKYESVSAARPRDADLTMQDRVDLLIDVDRDFATYYQLTVDSRGFTADSCWGDPTWNPSWYVAAALSDDAWTIEAAIPLDQLTGKASKSRDTWAVGVQRTIPGVGFQSWSLPASTDVMPEGFGYLIFE